MEMLFGVQSHFIAIKIAVCVYKINKLVIVIHCAPSPPHNNKKTNEVISIQMHSVQG